MTLALSAVAATSRSTHKAMAGEGHGQQVLDLMRELIRIAEKGGPELRPRLIRVLRARADTQAIAMFALGSWRKKLPAELRHDYVQLVVEYTANAFIGYVDRFAHAEITILENMKSSGVVTVSAELKYADGRRSEIRFRFAEKGNMRVRDVNVQGIWLSLRLREQFDKVLARNDGDFAGLMTFLKAGAA